MPRIFRRRTGERRRVVHRLLGSVSAVSDGDQSARRWSVARALAAGLCDGGRRVRMGGMRGWQGELADLGIV